MPLTGWPTITDDSGTKTDGTIIDKALFDAIKASIEADVFSGSVSAADIIDEVVAARGTKASLDERLDVAMNEDGTLKAVAGQATEAQIATQLAVNWAYNDDFLIWPAGDAAAPSGFTFSGSAVARTGTGLGDGATKVGPFSAKITRAAADASLTQNIMSSASFSASGQHLKGRTFGFGAWVRSNVASAARIRFFDGDTSTASAYHPATPPDTWVWLSGVHTVSNSATQLQIILEMTGSAGDAYFSGVTVLPSSVAPTNWVPCPKVYGAITWKKGGVLAAGTDLDRWSPGRPMLVKDTVLHAITAPLNQAIIVDINVWDGSAWQSMYSTKPQIAASAGVGGAAPDGTYRYRCIAGSRTTVVTNSRLNWDIDQVGTGTAGSDLSVSIRAMQYARPQESMLDVTDF